MPSAISPEHSIEPPDDLDELFNYDAGLEAATIAGEPSVAAIPEVPVAHIDEEIVVTKKRQPIAKLDETRILSSSGILKLRKISKQMRFKGKGHEFSDMAKLLHMYQIWLDDLYPRAKFADGLAIIEKLGHKKRIQMERKQWIDEGKPRTLSDDVGERIEHEHTGSDSLPESDAANGEDHPSHGVEDHDPRRRDGTPGQEANMRPSQEASMVRDVSEQPGEDELDTLMAEAQGEIAAKSNHDDSERFADEEEAMAGLDW
ncbi:hypothetical protein ANO11243_060260 [Dothideomycetidae sp. 11243]|nr:hypothetical protein ANO11243_060260 [fungal sp. No.11243]